MTLGHWNFAGSRAVVGISDDQLAQEQRVERRLQAAIAEMRRAIDDVNKTSAVVEIEPSALEDFVSDECPDHDYWAEKLTKARQR
jgi:hypothetical protein